MASILAGLLGGGTISQVVVRIAGDSSPLAKELAKAKGETQAAAKSMGDSGKTAAAGWTAGTVAIAAGAVAAGAALVKLGIEGVKAATALNESVNRAEVQFGDASESVIKFAEDAEKIGIAESVALNAASAFGAMAQSAGISEEASAELSTTLVQLAADMASFNNQDPSEMLERLRSGLAGEAEPLRQFGVFISEARVKSVAYAEGIAAVGEELTDAQKIQARFNIIMQDTAKQQGDFARTVGDSLPNQVRVFQASLENLQAEIGQALLPVLGDLMDVASQLLEDVGPALVTIFQAIGNMLQMVADQISPVLRGFGELIDFLNDPTWEKFAPSQDKIVNGLETMAGWLPVIGPKVHEYADAWRAADAAQEDAANSAADVAGRTTFFADQLGTAIPVAAGVARSELENMAGAARDAADATGAAGSAATTAVPGVDEFSGAEARLADAASRSAAAMRDQYLATLQLEGGALGVISASQQWHEAQRNLVEVQEDSKSTAAELTAAEVAVAQAYIGLRSQAVQLKNDMEAQGMSQQQVHDSLVALGIQAGLTRGQAVKLADSVTHLTGEYGKVPKNVSTQVTAPGLAGALQLVHNYNAALIALPNYVHISVVTEYQTIGHGVQIAEGGIVAGQSGFITQGPTMMGPGRLVGEGMYGTFAGTGAEAVIPLNGRGVAILAEAMRRAMVQDTGSTSVPSRTIVENYHVALNAPNLVSVGVSRRDFAEEFASDIEHALRRRKLLGLTSLPAGIR